MTGYMIDSSWSEKNKTKRLFLDYCQVNTWYLSCQQAAVYPHTDKDEFGNSESIVKKESSYDKTKS